MTPPVMQVCHYESGSIHEVVQSGSLAHYQYVLITAIDSSFALAGSLICGRLLSHYKNWSILEQSIVAPGGEVQEANALNNIFTGFGEVWCFQKRPAKIPPASILPPCKAHDLGKNLKLAEWMLANECRFGMGDGIGMNVISAESEIWTAANRLFH